MENKKTEQKKAEDSTSKPRIRKALKSKTNTISEITRKKKAYKKIENQPRPKNIDLAPAGKIQAQHKHSQEEARLGDKSILGPASLRVKTGYAALVVQRHEEIGLVADVLLALINVAGLFGAQVGQDARAAVAGLLNRLAQGSLLGRLAQLDVALGQNDLALRHLAQQQDLAVINDDATGGVVAHDFHGVRQWFGGEP